MKVLPNFSSHLKDCVVNTEPSLFLMRFNLVMEGVEKFFSFQYHGIHPDIISMAKGMGNGFPVGGILISNKIKASYGLLGTTFGGNHLACAAAISVLDVIEKERLMENVTKVSAHFLEKIKEIEQIRSVKGKGLMLGVSFDFPVAQMRKQLIFEEGNFYRRIFRS